MARHFASRLDPDMKLIWWEDEGNGANPSPLLNTAAESEAPGAGRPPLHVRIRRA
jgi:hypothetical protein